MKRAIIESPSDGSEVHIMIGVIDDSCTDDNLADIILYPHESESMEVCWARISSILEVFNFVDTDEVIIHDDEMTYLEYKETE